MFWILFPRFVSRVLKILFFCGHPKKGHGQSGVINDIALSKFHVLTMHQNAIVATCLLNNQLVFSDEFDRKDPILGFRQNSTEGRDPQTIGSGP